MKINRKLLNVGRKITLKKSSEQSFTAGARPTVSWQTVDYNDTNDLLIKDGNNVKINGDVNTVLVNARVQGLANGAGAIYIMKNSEEIAITGRGAGISGIEICNPVNVTKGDTISIQYYNPQAGKISAASAWTNFTVTILN